MVHADAASFMAARLTPGKRAVSISITTDTGAGGFILPNDRVDVLLTQQVGDSQSRHATTKTILDDVRVLAMDQTFTQDKDQKTVLAKTATLELAPDQAALLTRAAASGSISLTLRALGDNSTDDSVAAKFGHHHANDSQVVVVRYGMARGSLDSRGE